MTTELYYNDFLNRLISIYEPREAANITEWVFENVTGLKRLQIELQKNAELKKEYLTKLEDYLKKLLQHKPVQYVLNEAWFYKMKFYVNEHVLIPRPETEELVGWAISDIKNYKTKDEFKVLDIGAGSGCMGVSVKKELANLNVTAIDISKDALQVAGKNAELLNTKINFIEIDFLNEESWSALDRYNMIMSNPPYIPVLEKEKLAKNVTEFEPGIALFVADNDPFIFYEKIAKFAQSHLKANGNVYVEIHENYSGEVQQIFSSYNFETEIRKDIYGRDRMIKANQLPGVY